MKGDRRQSFEELAFAAKQRILLNEIREDYAQLETAMERMSDANWRLREVLKELLKIIPPPHITKSEAWQVKKARAALAEGGTDEQI